jgi:hypothetical protein
MGLSHPHVTRDGSLIYDFRVPKGCLRCPVLASLVAAVLMMIDESLRAIWGIESMRHS